MSLVVKNALNGDTNEVDPAVRRTLYAIANEMDEQADQWDERIDMLSHKIDDAVVEFKSDVKSVRRLLIGLTSTVIGGIVIGIVNVIVNVNL